MLVALPALLVFLHCSCPAAVRPQDAEDQASALIASTKSAHHPATEALTVGHLASLRRDRNKKRLHHVEHLDPAVFSHSASALDVSGNSLDPDSGAASAQAPGKVANKLGNVAPEVSKNQETASTPVEPKGDQDAANKGSPAPKKDINSQSDNHTAEAAAEHHLSKTFELPLERPTAEHGPVADLIDDPEKGRTKDPDEGAQEWDNLINDSEEVSSHVMTSLERLGRFFEEEGYRFVALGLVFYLAAIFIAVGFYFMWFQHREIPKEQDFRYGIFDCFGDFRICICGMCCLPIRWADTVSEEKGGFLLFSTALLLSLAIGVVMRIPMVAGLGWIASVAVGVHFRQKIREKYGLENATLPSYCEDFFAWCCCACCAVCQEARQVDDDEGPKEIDSTPDQAVPEPALPPAQRREVRTNTAHPGRPQALQRKELRTNTAYPGRSPGVTMAAQSPGVASETGSDHSTAQSSGVKRSSLAEPATGQKRSPEVQAAGPAPASTEVRKSTAEQMRLKMEERRVKMDPGSASDSADHLTAQSSGVATNSASDQAPGRSSGVTRSSASQQQLSGVTGTSVTEHAIGQSSEVTRNSASGDAVGQPAAVTVTEDENGQTAGVRKTMSSQHLEALSAAMASPHFTGQSSGAHENESTQEEY